MTRLKAFWIHIAISLSIFTCLLYLIVFHWYPSPFFSTDGGWQGLRLIAAVDIVLGPVLTLVIYNPKKAQNKRRMDLSIIGVIQMAALMSGSWVVYSEHPVAKVIVDGIVIPVSAKGLASSGMKLDELEKFGSSNTMTIYSDLPDDLDSMQKIRIKSIQQNQPLALNTNLYKKIDAAIIKKLPLFSIDMEKYLSGKDKEMMVYRKFLAQQDKPASDFLFLPIHSRYNYTIAVLDKKTAEFIDVLTKIPSPQTEKIDKLRMFKRKYIPMSEEKN